MSVRGSLRNVPSRTTVRSRRFRARAQLFSQSSRGTRSALLLALLCTALLGFDVFGTASAQTASDSPGGYTATASISPDPVVPGSTANVQATVDSSAAGTVRVNVEVHDASGAKVFQDSLENATFVAGETATFPFSWQVPADQAQGTYTLMVGVFSPDWSQLYTWNNNAAQLTIGDSGPAIAAPQPAAAPDFTLSVSPGSLIVHPVSRNRAVVSTAALGGFDAPVTFTVHGFPPDANAYVLPEPLTVSSSGTGGTLTVVSGATRGSFLLTITASGGGMSHTATVELVIQ